MGALLSLERELAGVLSLADLAGPGLDAFQRLAGAAGSTLFCFPEHGLVHTRGGSLEQAMRSYTQDLFAEDALQHWSMSLPGSMFISDAVHPSGKTFDLAAHLRSRPYADFYRPHDIAFALGIWPTGLRFGSPNMFGLLLTTPPPFRPFAPKVVAQLRRLEVPLRSAAGRIRRFSALEQRNQVLELLLGRQLGAFVLWDPEGRLSWASPSARVQLAGNFRRADFVEAARLAQHQLRRQDASEHQAILGRPQQIRSAHGSPLSVLFSWVPGPDRRPWLLAELDESVGARALLAQLTGAETRVLRLLAQGLSNAELSERLQVSQETVKTHVRRILLKLGTGSRAKAVAIAREAGGAGGAAGGNGRTDA